MMLGETPVVVQSTLTPHRVIEPTPLALTSDVAENRSSLNEGSHLTSWITEPLASWWGSDVNTTEPVVESPAAYVFAGEYTLPITPLRTLMGPIGTHLKHAATQRKLLTTLLLVMKLTAEVAAKVNAVPLT
jgi:hypothetical protein